MLRTTFLSLALTSAAGADVLITEIMYDPASSESSWEWIEILNDGPTIDFEATPWVIDDSNAIFHETPNITSGVVPGGAIAVLYDADALTADEFRSAWGDVAHLIPVTGWFRMQLNNTSDDIAMWSSFADYMGDHEAHANAAVVQSYVSGAPFPDRNDASSIFLPFPFGDPADGASWALSEQGAAGAWASLPASGNSGLDVGSPGVVEGLGGACASDCVRDGFVDIADLLALLSAWGAPSPCDSDGDGVVGEGDLLTLLAAWGACP